MEGHFLKILMERLAMISTRRGSLLFLVCYFALVAITLLAAPLPQMILPWESFGFYEGGWRVLQGITPHVDYYSPLGPLIYLITALGMVVTSGSFNSLSWGIALASVPVALASWHFLSLRLTPFSCLLACVYLMATWMLPFSLRFGFRDLTYGGFYNREGYVLLGLLVFLLLFPRLKNQNNYRADMMIAGSSLGLMSGIKINFLIIAALFVGFYLLDKKDRLNRCGWMGCGFAFIVLPLLAYLRFDIPAILRDFTTMTLARSQDTVSDGVRVIFRDIPIPAFFNLVALMAEVKMRFPTDSSRGGERKGFLFSRGLEFAVFEGAQVLALLSNAPEGGNPDIPLLDIYGLIQVLRLMPYMRLGEVPHGKRSWIMAAILGAGYPIGRSFILFFLGFAFCFLTSVSHFCDSYFIPLERPSEGRVEILRVGKYGYNADFVSSLEEGMALLSRHIDVHQARIGSFDATNPFPFILRGKSPPGMPTFWHEGRNVSLLGYPPAEEVFRDCDCVLVPRLGVVPSTTPVLLRVYADTLRNEYSLVEGTRYWDLYVKKSLVHNLARLRLSDRGAFTPELASLKLDPIKF